MWSYMAWQPNEIGDIGGMLLEENKIYNMDNREGLIMLPEKCANLIIADPPYFEIKGEFDFVWKSFDEYLEFMEHQAQLYKRILADNGSLFIYGDRKNIAYIQIIFDRYFNFENHIYWQKSEKCQMEMFDTLRSFYCRGYERVLFYSNEIEMTGLERIYLNQDCFARLRIYSQSIRNFCDYSRQKMIDTLGNGKAQHFLEPYGPQWQLCTKGTYQDLIEHFGINQMAGFREYEDLRREYEDLRREYEDLRRPFNNFLKLSDHWFFTNGNANDYEHETVKSEQMTRAMILTCSRENDLVVIPFAGSGTECAMAAKEGRRFIGFEIKKEYCEMAMKRTAPHLQQMRLAI